MAGCMADPRTYNIYFHSICFCFIFAAFQTATGIGQTVLKRFKEAHNETCYAENAGTENLAELCKYKEVDGYLSQMILYAVFGVMSWFVPLILNTLTPKMGMFLGGITYALYVSSYIYPNFYYLWVCSVLLGAGAGILWTSQGTFLTANGTDEDKDKNAGMFWGFLQGGALLGNLIVLVVFRDGISNDSRILVFMIFTVLTAIGVMGFLTLRVTPQAPSEETVELKVMSPDRNQEESKESQLDVLKRSMAMLSTKSMILVLPIFIYTGVSQVIWSATHSTAIGSSVIENMQDHNGTHKYADPFSANGLDIGQLLAIAGISMALGQVLAGVLSPRLPFSTQIKMVLACSIHLLGLAICYSNFHDLSPSGKSVEELKKENADVNLSGAYFEKTQYPLALVSAVMLAFGDGILNTQVYFYLSTTYTNSSAAPAFGIFKSIQSFTVAIMFGIVGSLPLTYTILLAAVFNVATIICYKATGFTGST